MPKPRAYRDYEEGYDLIQGSAATASRLPDADEDRLVATLWLPNPEYRSGWNEWNVYAKPRSRRRRRLGFGR